MLGRLLLVSMQASGAKLTRRSRIRGKQERGSGCFYPPEHGQDHGASYSESLFGAISLHAHPGLTVHSDKNAGESACRRLSVNGRGCNNPHKGVTFLLDGR